MQRCIMGEGSTLNDPAFPADLGGRRARMA